MFTVSGQTVKYDRAWTHPDTGVQYPANWLRLASPAEKQAVGLVEVTTPASAVYDQRFYWNSSTPKQLNDEPILGEDGNDTGEVQTGLKTQWKNTQDEIAASLLASSDWRVIKAKETSTNIPSLWKTHRAAVRTACNTRQSEIDACSDVAALKELLFGSAQIQQTDDDGNGVVDSDGNAVMIDNPNLATAWPDDPS